MLEITLLKLAETGLEGNNRQVGTGGNQQATMLPDTKFASA
jgi:hypothetical protein